MGEKLKDWLWALKKNKRAQIILWVVLGLILLLILIYISYVIWSNQRAVNEALTNANTNANKGNTAEVGDKAPRLIDGKEVPIQESNLVPIAMMIENLVTIRPQSGLGAANLIYEALAEGGITRFLAIYANTENIDPIGPVRSARHYYVDWAEEYGGLYAHVGGSPQALGILGTDDYMADLNQFGFSQYYYRDDNLEAPHNLFTRSELMAFALRDMKLDTQEGDYDPYLFKDDKEKKSRPTQEISIQIEFSSFDYNVEWRYDRDINAYLRFNGGEPHTDANTEKQLSAKNIVVQRVESSLLEADSGRLDITTIGEGNAILFQDGVAMEGTWKKTSRGERTKFYTSEGNEFKFNPGTTWIEVVPIDNNVTY